MLSTNHPDDERLSALAARDADATADASLTAHLSTCDRCTDLVNELGALRAALAELPDLQPSRPLRLLPEAAEAPARVDRLGGWARRFFAPVLSAGAALAMVGLVGTAAPAISGMASSGAAAPEAAQTSEIGAPAVVPGTAADRAAESSAGVEDAVPGEGDAFLEASGAPLQAGPSDDEAAGGVDTAGVETAPADVSEAGRLREVPADRSPWPMVLFTGVALMVAAVLLRWILVPRGG